LKAHDSLEVSDWIRRWSHLVPEGARVLDVACGYGRHMAWFAARGCAVTGIDRDTDALAKASAYGHTVQADIENGPWPLMQQGQLQTFDAVVVTNYLWRPLFSTLLASLSPGGLLLYETFSHSHARIGKPSRPDFLLQDGELLHRCAWLHVIAYENGFLNAPARCVQRIAACAPGAPQHDASAPRTPALLWLE